MQISANTDSERIQGLDVTLWLEYCAEQRGREVLKFARIPLEKLIKLFYTKASTSVNRPTEKGCEVVGINPRIRLGSSYKRELSP